MLSSQAAAASLIPRVATLSAFTERVKRPSLACPLKFKHVHQEKGTIMWDDLAPGIAGAGPTHTVTDPDGTPNNILDVTLGGTVTIDWSFSGPAIGLLDLAEFSVQLWADPVGLGSNTLVGGAAIVVPGTVTVVPPAAQSYEAVITIAPNELPVGAYRLTTLITCDEGGISVPIAGFVEGPILQVRPAP